MMSEEEKVLTAIDFVRDIEQLEEEAAEALPGRFDKCTFDRGYVRQPLYACLSCANDQKGRLHGFCYSCSISCHGDHEVIELFTKRHFRCDCGTQRCNVIPCTLNKPEEDRKHVVNLENAYNHNFSGRYCSCDTFYDPAKEPRVMLQCLVCEDWYHDSCVGAIMDEDAFEDFACSKCVGKLRWMLDYPDYSVLSANGKLTFHGETCEPGRRFVVAKPDTKKENDPEVSSMKRPLGDDETCRRSKVKRAKVETSKSQTSPPPTKSTAPHLFSILELKDILCQCTQCLDTYIRANVTFLVKPDPIVEPERDEAAKTSLYDAGMKALESVPRTDLAPKLAAFEDMRREMREFFVPFVQSGRVVTKDDIRDFFSRHQRPS